MTMINAKEKPEVVFSLNSSSPAKLSSQKITPNVLGILLENIYESFIF